MVIELIAVVSLILFLFSLKFKIGKKDGEYGISIGLYEGFLFSKLVESYQAWKTKREASSSLQSRIEGEIEPHTDS